MDNDNSDRRGGQEDLDFPAGRSAEPTTTASVSYSASDESTTSLSELRQMQNTQLLNDTNRLLSAIGISAKQISSVEELQRVTSSMIVAIYESIFQTRLENIIRNPQTRAQYVHNAQIVINELSERIQMDLAHITGESVVGGDFFSISYLVNLFTGVVIITDGTEPVDTMTSLSLQLPGAPPSKEGASRRLTKGRKSDPAGVNVQDGGRRFLSAEDDRMQDSISVSTAN
jgi:hypothetical protein